MPHPDSIIIIGAGVAGLAAGCYAQMNGYRTEIFEMHHLPGGLCTAWERRGYTFDGCLHYLFGTADGAPFNQIWRELGVADRPYINHDSLMTIVSPTDERLTVYADPDRLEAHLLDIAPVDAGEIAALTDGVRRFLNFDLASLQDKPRTLYSPEEWAGFGRRMLPYLGPLMRWGRLTARDYAARFSDPFLRRAIVPMFGWPDIPVMVGMFLLAYLARGNAGFPAGGSLEFARGIERRYLALGGTIHYKAQVEKILVEDGRAVGVRLYDDSVHYARRIISAADGRNTIFHMLDGEFVDRGLRRQYDGRLPVHTQVQVSLGIDRDLSTDPHWAYYLYDKPFLVAGESKDALSVKQFGYDPGLAPPGKSAVVVAVDSRYDYWARIYGRRLYDTEQLQVADIALDLLERRYPGLRDQVEVKDVATPLSYERYTGNWLGSTSGWLLTDKTMLMMVQGVDKTLPGLENLYLAGQWVEPGGSVPIVAQSGRNAVQLICAADGRGFGGE